MIPKKPVLGLNPRMDTSFRKKTAIARQPLGWIKTQKNCGKAKLWNLPAWLRVLLTVAWAFDKKIFENESVFPAVERSAATDATHRRVNRRWGFNFHQRVLCRAMRAVERICT
jgi:hypothetical protein